jgi:hypothetical protein
MEDMGKIPSRLQGISALVLLLLLGAGCRPAPPPPEPLPTLTREEALVLLKDDVTDCEPAGVPERYRSCTLTIVPVGNEGYLVTVTHDGFFDDSVKASRIEVAMTRSGGAWVKGAVIETQQCWPGRGHQDFSAELCV